jgi:hypothetical protein
MFATLIRLFNNRRPASSSPALRRRLQTKLGMDALEDRAVPAGFYPPYGSSLSYLAQPANPGNGGYQVNFRPVHHFHHGWGIGQVNYNTGMSQGQNTTLNTANTQQPGAMTPTIPAISPTPVVLYGHHW